MGEEREVGHHLLVGKLITLRALNHTIQSQHSAICLAAHVQVKSNIISNAFTHIILCHTTVVPICMPFEGGSGDEGGMTLTHTHALTFERPRYPEIWTSHDGAPSPPAAIKIDPPIAHLAQKTNQTVFDPYCILYANARTAEVHVESSGWGHWSYDFRPNPSLTTFQEIKGLTFLSFCFALRMHGRGRGDGQQKDGCREAD